MASPKPRLLVLGSTFPRWEGDTEPRFVESLSYELARDFDVTVLAPHCRGAALQETFMRDDRSLDVHRYRYGFDFMETLAYDGGILTRIRSRPWRLFLLPLFLLGQWIKINRLHAAKNFDAVHAHWMVPQGVVAAAFRAWSRKSPPLLVTSHGGDLYALRGRFLEAVQRRVLRRADAVTVVSHAMRDYCEKRNFAPQGITVQSMGVDLKETFTPGDEELPREGLVFVGRLVEKKGVEYLIDAMAYLSDSHPDVRLRIVGDGPLRAALEERAASLGVQENIEFVGSVLNEEVPGYLRRASISVMPSVIAASGDQEGLGLVAVEGMGCGCAVVASDLPAVRDTVKNGETGLMAEPENGEDLARKIAMLLDDDALRRKLAQAGRRHAIDNFDWRSVGTRYANVISAMIQEQ